MRNYLVYTLLTVGILGLLGVGFASAHGWSGFSANFSPEEITQRFETMFQNKADLLGISVDEMKSAWAEGKTLMEIAEEQGISQEQLQETIREGKRERLQSHLQTLVDNGVINQEQADQRLQTMEERFENGDFGKGCHGGFGRGFGW